ncbi:MAG: hypothetical protein IJW70_01975 [Clostridia bacterium]|nr:hypothetical protein [Clostridia bacterium]
MRILCIGNSYTYFSDMPSIVSELLNANGVDGKVDAVTVGGRKLYENLTPEDASCQHIKALCAQGTYDAVILQEQSCFPLVDYETFLEGVRGCADLVNAGRTVLYATWGRKRGSALLAERGWTSEGMTAALADAYEKVAQAIGGECAHVGRCFAAIGATCPEIELYDPDLSHPSYAGSCVAGLALYKTLLGALPQNTSVLLLDASVVARLAEVIDTVI